MKWPWHMMFCLMLFSLSCDLVQDHHLNPSTIKVSSVSLTNSNNAPLSHAIRDIWVYIDDQYAGSFTVPFFIPVLESGERNLKLYPGIRYYGILSKPEIHPLIEPIETTQNLIAGNVVELQAKFHYKNNLSIILNEGFESGSIFINDLDSFPASKLVRSGLLSRNGNFAGYAALDKQNTVVESASTFFTLSNKKTVFLEFDFKSDVDFNVGIISYPSKQKNYFLALRPAADWKKVYIPLHEIVFENNEQNFQLAFRASISNTLAMGYFAIDNVSVLSIQ